MPTADEPSVATADTSVSSLPLEEFGAAPISRRQHVTGLAVVLAVAFASSVLTSVLRVRGVHFDYPDALIGYRYFFTLFHELIALALLAYVVWQNRQTLADLGAVFRATDIVYGVLLWIVTDACYRLAFPTILSVCEQLGWHKAPPYYPSAQLGLGLITYCFVVVNPVYEK
jgi:hypothetical protein